MHPPGTLHSRPATVVRKAVPNARDMSVTAVLTYPGTDLAGDRVHPAGLEFSEHIVDPWNDLEHNGECVGWARESLKLPDAGYSVRRADLTIENATHRLPVGTTYFDPRDRLSSQVFALCERDALPGVSLEFRPVAGFYKSLGPSPLERRDAFEFRRASVVRWCHCARPVNEGALTVTKSLAAADPLLSILSANRVGSEQLHPTITKSLAQYLPARKAFVGGFGNPHQPVRKAMDEQTIYDDAEPDVAAVPEPGGGDETSPTAQAAYDAAQRLSDAMAALDDLEGAIATSEHKAGKKKLAATAEQARAAVGKLAEKFTAIGDQIHADVNDGDGDMDEDDDEPDVPEEDMEPGEDGVLKAFSKPVRKAYRPNLKRFSLAEVRKAEVAPAGPSPAEREKQREAKRLRKSLRRSNPN